MANPEWGTKRICQNCGAKFYDMTREPIVCPRCHTEFDPEAFLKTRRARTAVVAEKEVPVADVAGAELEDAEPVEEDEAVVLAESGDEEEEDVIEDASELGEDEDDMAEVIENVDSEEER